MGSKNSMLHARSESLAGVGVNDQHCVFIYLLEFVPVTAIQKNCFGKIFAYKTHPNFGGNF